MGRGILAVLVGVACTTSLVYRTPDSSIVAARTRRKVRHFDNWPTNSFSGAGIVVPGSELAHRVRGKSRAFSRDVVLCTFDVFRVLGACGVRENTAQ